MVDSIALGGGGTRGFIHLGVLRAVQESRGSLDFPGGIYGQSIGAILATAVAFRIPLSTIDAVCRETLQMSRVIPEIRLDHLTQLLETKGLVSMDSFEVYLLDVFDRLGVNLRGLRIGEAPQKLFIVASNLTTGKPCLLTGDVPIVQALRCSCCIPFLFRPEVMYGQVYVDGAVYSRCIRQVVPPTTLVIHISGGHYNPTDLGSYLHAIVAGPISQYRSTNTFVVENVPASMLTDASPEQATMMIQEGYSQARSWLAEWLSERLDQKGA